MIRKFRIPKRRSRGSSDDRSTARIARFGLSLLEVILALAIFAGSMAVLGELIRAGIRNASEARDFTRAEIYAESIMSQIVAGALPVAATSGSPVEDDPNFVYSVNVGEIQSGLLEVQVTVTRNLATPKLPAEYTLVRWMVDPQMEAELAAQAQANAQAAAEARAQSQSQAQQNTSTNATPGGTNQQGGQQ